MFRIRVTALILAALAVLAAGCAGTGPAKGDGSAALPEWVRVVLYEVDGRTQFVGGVAMADDVTSGLEAAKNDALSQIHAVAARRFGDLFTRSALNSGIETTAMERLDFRGTVAENYASRMQEAAGVDKSYWRPCGGASGAKAEGPVCQAFVLVSVDASLWDSELKAALQQAQRNWFEEGRRNLAKLADWLTVEIDGRHPGGTRARAED